MLVRAARRVLAEDRDDQPANGLESGMVARAGRDAVLLVELEISALGARDHMVDVESAGAAAAEETRHRAAVAITNADAFGEVEPFPGVVEAVFHARSHREGYPERPDG